MRWRDADQMSEPCPHCGRNACGWHLPGRVCRYRYADQPGEVRPRPYVVTLNPKSAAFTTFTRRAQ